MMPDLFLGIYYYYVFMHTLLNLIEKNHTKSLYIYIYRDIPSKNQNVYIFYLSEAFFSRKKQLKHFSKKNIYITMAFFWKYIKNI